MCVRKGRLSAWFGCLCTRFVHPTRNRHTTQESYAGVDCVFPPVLDVYAPSVEFCSGHTVSRSGVEYIEKEGGRNTNQPCGWLVFLPLRVVLSCCVVWCRRLLTLPHPGGCSTISVGRLSFRVRNGYRALPCHYHHRQTYKGLSMSIFFVCVHTFGWCVRYCIVDAKPKWCDCDPTVLCGSFLFWLCLFGGLVPVTFTCYHASRSGLSTP